MPDTSREGFFRRFEEAFQEWREQQPGRDQKQLAVATNAPPSSVNGWVKGRSLPDGDNMLKLPVVLGVRAEWLLNGIGPKRAAPGVKEGFVAGVFEAVREIGKTWWRLVRQHNLMETERFIVEIFGEKPVYVAIHRPPGQPEPSQQFMNAIVALVLDEMPQLRWAARLEAELIEEADTLAGLLAGRIAAQSPDEVPEDRTLVMSGADGPPPTDKQ